MELNFNIEDEMANAFRKLLPEVKSMIVEAVNNTLGDQLLSVESAAQVLGLSTHALRKRIARGQIRVVRNGRSIRIRRSELFN